MAEVANPRPLFSYILQLIAELRPPRTRHFISVISVRGLIVVPCLQSMREVRLDHYETLIHGTARRRSPVLVQGRPYVEELGLQNPSKAAISASTRPFIRWTDVG